MKLIVAVNNNGSMGKDGKMMWRSSDDFKHFKEKTMGGILIVGATTFENDLQGKQLPGRETIVVGSKYHTLFEAVERAIELKHEHITNTALFGPPDIKTIWVIGGISIYKQLYHLCSEMHISIIDNDDEGDIKFLDIDITNYYFRGKTFYYYFKTNNAKV